MTFIVLFTAVCLFVWNKTKRNQNTKLQRHRACSSERVCSVWTSGRTDYSYWECVNVLNRQTDRQTQYTDHRSSNGHDWRSTSVYISAAATLETQHDKSVNISHLLPPLGQKSANLDQFLNTQGLPNPFPLTNIGRIWQVGVDQWRMLARQVSFKSLYSVAQKGQRSPNFVCCCMVAPPIVVETKLNVAYNYKPSNWIKIIVTLGSKLGGFSRILDSHYSMFLWCSSVWL